jgi:peptidoglycan/xylan/chitin deacetylase (PgdA/CDA1 family)
MTELRRALLGLNLLLGAAMLCAASIFIPPQGQSWFSADMGERKVVALTFDDGPNPPHTDALLALLAREQVRVSFYRVGAPIPQHPATA